MGLSIGECKENLKPEEDFTAEDQGQQKNTRDRMGGSEQAIGGSDGNLSTSEEQGDRGSIRGGW